MHTGTVAKRIHGASRRVRRRFESRLGHFLSRTRMCTEPDGMLRNQVRSPPPKTDFNRLFALIWFSLD